MRRGKKRSTSKEILQEISTFYKETLEKISSYIIGYQEIIENLMIALLCEGHVLVIGLPGLGKTRLVKVLSRLWDLPLSRIQFTPDLLPADILGTYILQEKPKKDHIERRLEFQKGPIFAHLILADEINRTPPKTQSALLQAMEEKEVSIGNETFSLPDPFFVMATQNPIELEGTYPLPEAQLDRFFMSLYLDFPSLEEEKQIALLKRKDHLEKIRPIISRKKILEWRNWVDEVILPEPVLESILQTIQNTRKHEYIAYGAGPRATQFFVQAVRAYALLQGEGIVEKDMLKKVYRPILQHRIHLNYQAIAEGISQEDILEECRAF